MFHDAASKLNAWGVDRISLVITLSVVASVIIFRWAYSSVTGFLAPDEFWYYDHFVLGGLQIPIGYREVFLAVFLMFFRNVSDVPTLLLLGGVFCAFWAVGVVVVTYKILALLRLPDTSRALLMLSLPLFPVFIVFVPFVITETMGLFLALTGVYYILRFVDRGNWVSAVLSSLFFVMAYKVREPYLLLGIGSVLAVLFCAKRSAKSFVAYVIPISFIFPIPVGLRPLMLANPILTFIETSLYALRGPPGTNSTVIPRSAAQPIELLGSTKIVPVDLMRTPEALRGFFVGLFYGYNPLFLFLVFASIALLAFAAMKRQRGSHGILLLTAVLALSSYAVSVVVLVSTTALAVSTWTSTLIRYSHTSLPSIFGMGFLYKRFKPKYVAAVLIVFVVVFSTQVPAFTQQMQRSLQRVGQPIDRLNFNYRAPYYRLYLLAKGSGRTLVIGGVEMRGIVAYMSMLPNVKLVAVPPVETKFTALINQTWDAIYLYDDWYTVQDPSIAGAYPLYYWSLLHSQTYDGFVIHPIWVDAESYAFQLVSRN